MRWLRRSIRNTVLASIVLGVVLPALLVLAVDGHMSRQAQEPIAERNRQAVMVLASAVLTEPAWTLSEPGLEAAMMRVLEQPSVCGVEVLDLQPGAAPMRLSNCPAGAPAIEMGGDILHEGQTIARLRLHFDASDIDQALAQRRSTMAWLVAIQMLVGVTVLAGVLAVRLLRPIDALKRQAAGMAARETQAMPDWRGDDELGELGQHLGNVRGQIRSLIDELERKNGELQHLAMYDHLTGLPNRTLLAEIFTHEAALARRDGQPMALLFVDLDHFKAINDQHGHAAGDELLVAVAARVREVVRASDIVCRMGGDEFLVLLPRVDGWEQATATAERVIAAVRQPLVLEATNHPARIGASIGVAMFPDDGADFDALARAADVAMYRSKDLGRTRYSLYQPEMDAALRERLQLEAELADAGTRGEMRLFVQAIVDARTGHVRSGEALVRWQHPQRGLLTPDKFIEIAEASGAIHGIGRWVLDAACAHSAALARAGHEAMRLGVNVSALQLHDPDFASGVRETMKRHGVPPGILILELTESTLLADTDGVRRALAGLREAGVQLAIDDFGTDFSSLAALRLVRPEWLKVDRSFVRDLPDSAEARAFAEAIFAMARAMRIDVVAEGVETEAQRDWLLAQGCWRQQGYLFARPMPVDSFVTLLQAAALA